MKLSIKELKAFGSLSSLKYCSASKVLGSVADQWYKERIQGVRGEAETRFYMIRNPCAVVRDKDIDCARSAQYVTCGKYYI